MLLVGRIGVWEEAMPKPYSADLRERVLRADAAGLAPAVVAGRFGVGLSTVYLWRQQPRAAGQPASPVPGAAAAWAAAQKKTLRASERDRADIQAERAVFCEQVGQLDPKELVFIDETGITTAMTRLHARAPRGERAHGSAPGGWRRLTVLGALSAAVGRAHV